MINADRSSPNAEGDQRGTKDKKTSTSTGEIFKTKQLLLNRLTAHLNTLSDQEAKQRCLRQISNLLQAPEEEHDPVFLKYGVELPFRLLDDRFQEILRKEFLGKGRF